MVRRFSSPSALPPGDGHRSHVLLQPHSKAFKGLRSQPMAERVGAMGGCGVLRAGLILTANKDQRKNTLCVHYWDFCKRPVFVWNHRKCSQQNGLGVWTCLTQQQPWGVWGWWWCFKVLSSEGQDQEKRENICCESLNQEGSLWSFNTSQTSLH